MPSAAILAGGRASRFDGRDKGALVVDGRSILDRQLEELSQVADDIMIVGSTRPPQSNTEARIRHVPDSVSGCGPLAGLDAALRAARHDAVVVVACDMPFVTAMFLRHLLFLTASADAAVPRTEDGYHPLCAAYTRACQPAVARLLADQRLAMTGLLEEIKLRVVGLEEIETFGNCARLLANLNTPAAFDEIEALQVHET